MLLSRDCTLQKRLNPAVFFSMFDVGSAVVIWYDTVMFPQTLDLFEDLKFRGRVKN